MIFDGWEDTEALCANDISALITSSITEFPAGVLALAKAVDGLTAGDQANYLDFMCPWIRYNPTGSNLQIVRDVRARNNEVLVMSGCALAVMAMWRCLGLNGPELWNRYSYNPAEGRHGAVYEITEIAKMRHVQDEFMDSEYKGRSNWRAAQINKARAAANVMYSSALYTPQEMRQYNFDLFNVGDVWRVDDPEHVFTILDAAPVPVEVDGDTMYSVKCLHGGRRHKTTNRQLIEIADTEIVVKENGDVFYLDQHGKERQMLDIIRACFIPRLGSALLPPGWEEFLPPVKEPEPEAAPVVSNTPPAEGTFANRLLQTAITTQGNGYRPGLPGVRQYAPGAGPAITEGGQHFQGAFKGMWSDFGHRGRG